MSEEVPVKAFKGVWIPKAMWESTAITWMEKCLLAEIDSLDNDEGCFASNEWLAKRFGSTPASIANQISKLRKLKMLVTISFDGRQRRLKINPDSTKWLMEEEPPSECRVNPQVKAPIQEIPEKKDTPLPPKGDEATSESSSLKVLKKEKSNLPTSPTAIRVSTLFGRKLTTEWQDKEIRAFKKLKIDLDDLALIETYYAFERKKEGEGRHRRDLGTFLNNYLGELDRAREWRKNPKVNEKQKPSNGSTDRNAGTLNAGQSHKYAGVTKSAAVTQDFSFMFDK